MPEKKAAIRRPNASSPAANANGRARTGGGGGGGAKVGTVAQANAAKKKSGSGLRGFKSKEQFYRFYKMPIPKDSPAFKKAAQVRAKRLSDAKWLEAQAKLPPWYRACKVILRVTVMSIILSIVFQTLIRENKTLATIVSGQGSISGTMDSLMNAMTGVDELDTSNEMTWIHFQKAYKLHFQRTAPDTLEQWLNFAKSNKCEPFKQYKAIERDLYPFRKKLMRKKAQGNTQPLLDWDTILTIAAEYAAGAYMAVEIKDHTITIVHKDLSKWFEQHPTSDGSGWHGWKEEWKLHHNLEWLLEPVRAHTPPIQTRFVVNLHNIPKSPKDAAVPIFSMHHEHHHTDNDPQHPGNATLEIANKNRNGILDPRDDTTRDLLIPHLYTSGGMMGRGMTSSPGIGGFWFWPFYSSGPPLKSRQNMIAWRGATTGNYNPTHNPNTTNLVTNPQQLFFVGPRFDMMRKWGGTDVHPMTQFTTVQVDFAFTELTIANNEAHDEQTQQIMYQQARENFRFAKSLSFGQLQKYKYLLDVDGNGMFLCVYSIVWLEYKIVLFCCHYHFLTPHFDLNWFSFCIFL